MTLVLDSGALIALERNDRAMWRRLKSTHRAESPPRTHGGVVAQVWRGGSGRQALLARALDGIEISPLDDLLGRQAGALLGRSTLVDAIDAAVAVLADPDDVIATSDPGDLAQLVAALDRWVDVVEV